MESKNKGKKGESGSGDVYVRFYDSFSRTMEGVRVPLDEIDSKIDEEDKSVHYGIGSTENQTETQGITKGGTNPGVYAIRDLLFNPNSKEYYAITKYGKILHYDWAGIPILPGPKTPKKPFTNFIYCHLTSHFICWTPRKSSFFIAKEDFTVLIDSVSVAPIGSIIYGGRKNEDSFDFFIISGASLNRYSYHPGTNLINLQDAMTLSDIEAEKEVITCTCFDDPKDDRKQWIYLTFGKNCTIIDVTGRVHGTKKNLHNSKITAILAIGASEFVVTGDEKGILKCWGTRWAYIGEIKGHEGKILHIIEHPNEKNSISFGKDLKIFVWSLETLKEIESKKTAETVERIGINRSAKGFMTQGPRSLTMWKANTMYTFRTLLSAPVKSMFLTRTPDPRARVVVLTEDNCIRLLNPWSGTILTTVLITPIAPILRSFCFIRRANNEESVYALVETEGSGLLCLQQFDVGVNPAQWKKTYEETKWPVGITCIATYDYDPIISLPEKTMHFAARMKKTKDKKESSFLLCGRRDGCISVISLDTGEMTYFTACHKSAVLSITVDNEVNQAISIGGSPSIRLWKISLSQDEILLPLLDINWNHPIRFASIIRNVIAFPLDHADSDMHKICTYNTSKTEKYECPSKNAHKGEILSLSSCRELLIFCTASLDGTIKIWGAKNELFRTINLNKIPTYAQFVSAQGDIYVGIGKELHAIYAEKHLTIVPRTRALANGFSAGDTKENPLPQVTKLLRDPRMQIESSDEVPVANEPFPQVQIYDPPKDSQNARDLANVLFANEDLWKIIRGEHPIEETVPDFHHMTKQQWDEFGKSVYGDDGEDRKFFASESRLDTMLKLKKASKELDSFEAIE